MPHRAPQSRSNRPRILFVVTAAITLRFFDGTREELRARGYDVVLVSSPGERLEAARDAGFEAHAVAMAREMAPLRDLRSLLQLVRLFRRLRPQMVVAGTPKAGLLGTLAARLTGVPQIVLQMHGLRSETFTGWKRRLIAGTERISARLAHVTVCVSSSLCRRARQRGVLRADQGTVVGHGGANGILMEEFAPSAERHRAARKLRAQLGWGPQHRVLGYVGRLVSDKGAAELFTAFASLSRRDEWLRLLLIGGYEEGDPLPAPLREQLASHPAVKILDWVEPVAPWYAAMDVFVLPTYREGLPTVLLEAAAAGLPIVACRATGVVDAILEGKTALLVEKGSARQLEQALQRLLDDAELARHMGRAGAEWVARAFARQTVARNYAEFYQNLIHPRQRAGRDVM